jgi:hypothetical protein
MHLQPNSHSPDYLLNKEVQPEFYGTYIHSDLVHFVAEFISLDYAFKVAKIMKIIDERNKFLMKSLEDTVKELKENNRTLTQENSILKSSAVPKNFEHYYSYLIYEIDKNDTYTIFQTIRCQTKYLRKKQQKIIENNQFFYYMKELPISITNHLKVLEKVIKKIPGAMKLRFDRIKIPNTHLKIFKQIIEEIIYEHL